MRSGSIRHRKLGGGLYMTGSGGLTTNAPNSQGTKMKITSTMVNCTKILTQIEDPAMAEVMALYAYNRTKHPNCESTRGIELIEMLTEEQLAMLKSLLSIQRVFDSGYDEDEFALFAEWQEEHSDKSFKEYHELKQMEDKMGVL